MTTIAALDLAEWRPALTPEVQERAVKAIEDGGVLVLPHLNFALTESELRFLSPAWSDGRAKNISVEQRKASVSAGPVTPEAALAEIVLKGASGAASDLRQMAAMVARFAERAAGLVATLYPRYAPYVQQARTSFRPQPATGRDVSWRKDDSRLHIDAFPSRPNQGARILRVFTNLHPREDRVWRVGEPFEAMATAFLPRIRPPFPGTALLLETLHVTKGRRSPYDHLMLNLHDCAKADLAYQRDCPQTIVRFAPGTTWLCFSDQVMHAAVSGQYMMEQTIHLPVAALYDPARSPLAILERLTGHALVPAH
jgi:3-deoxy-D-manno-oct-2-ulosonic acid (Kdo) hydroxylase